MQFIIALGITTHLYAGELLIGTAVTDITPDLPVALSGQFEMRIAHIAETPLTASVVALESRNGNLSTDAAIMVSCDVIDIPMKLLQMVRDEVQKKIPELDTRKIFLNGTHTHTAPVLENDIDGSFIYPIPGEGVLQVEEYDGFFVKQVSGAIVQAWEKRRPGKVTWALSHAAVANNRRTVYADGSAEMYGNTNQPDFTGMEGIDNHDVNLLFFWNNSGKLIAMSIQVSCTAQEVESRSAVNADYWYPVREELKQRFGPDLCVLGWIGPSGDQSPHLLYRQKAEERMIKLRNLTRLEEIARRIVVAVEEAYETVKEDLYTDIVLSHKVEILNLPLRKVTEEEYTYSKAEQDKYAAQIANDPKAGEQVLTALTWNRDVVNRFERQKNNPSAGHMSEIHVLRIGDVVICTNEFELFTDFGIRIQARSNALQTIVIQLAGPGSYLATEKAVKGGGYSAVIQSNLVGPEGGQILVDRTVEMINEMFVGKE